MLKSNEETLKSYDLHVKEYLKTTPQSIEEHKPEMREWLDATLSNVPKNGVIFEIGSATLRDATYMRRGGYKVICSDATPGFVRELQNLGENAKSFNILKDSFDTSYDAIFANGVFPHFTYDETMYALKNIQEHLKPKGVFSFSIKIGTGEEWITEKFNEGRFTHYWTENDIINALNHNDFEVIFSNSNQGPYPSHHWLNLVCRKKSS